MLHEKRTKVKCSVCQIRGYSPEICRMHLLRCAKPSRDHGRMVYWGSKAIVGAGLGVGGVFAGMAVIPAFGIKGLLGQMIAVKIAGGGGVVGAGANMAVNIKQTKQKIPKCRKRRATRLIPKILSS